VRTFIGQRRQVFKIEMSRDAKRAGPLCMALFVRFRSSRAFPAVVTRDIVASNPSGISCPRLPPRSLVIDVQESFRHRPYWCDHHVSAFRGAFTGLIDGAEVRKIPVLQIFHVEESAVLLDGVGPPGDVAGSVTCARCDLLQAEPQRLGGKWTGRLLTQHGIVA